MHASQLTYTKYSSHLSISHAIRPTHTQPSKIIYTLKLAQLVCPDSLLCPWGQWWCRGRHDTEFKKNHSRNVFCSIPPSHIESKSTFACVSYESLNGRRHSYKHTYQIHSWFKKQLENKKKQQQQQKKKLS